MTMPRAWCCSSSSSHEGHLHVQVLFAVQVLMVLLLTVCVDLRWFTQQLRVYVLVLASCLCKSYYAG